MTPLEIASTRRPKDGLRRPSLHLLTPRRSAIFDFGSDTKNDSGGKAMVTPEQKLWRAVLEQAYADAEDAVDDGFDFVPPWRKGAREFLRAGSRQDATDLEFVCAGAEIPMDRVAAWARQHYSAEVN
jgi:hypothetical protein